MKALGSGDIIIDVSHWQGAVDWAKVAAYTLPDGRKVKGAFLKATQGTSYIDDTVYDNFNGAKEQGLWVGLYHYTVATSVADTVKEIDFFRQVYDACGGVDGCDFPPVLDIEDSSIKALGAATATAIAEAWLSGIASKYNNKITPWIYCNVDWINNYLGSSLGKYPLWLASYSGATPSKTTWSDWKIWQYTQTGTVSGIAGCVDMNEYNGRLEKQMTQTATALETIVTSDDLETLANRITALEQTMSMSSVPTWAQSSVNKAVTAGLIDTPNGGSYDFYRLLAIMDRKGMLG